MRLAQRTTRFRSGSTSRAPHTWSSTATMRFCPDFVSFQRRATRLGINPYWSRPTTASRSSPGTSPTRGASSTIPPTRPLECSPPWPRDGSGSRTMVSHATQQLWRHLLRRRRNGAAKGPNCIGGGGGHSRCPPPRLALLDDCVAVRRAGENAVLRTRGRLRELVHAFEVVDGVGEVDAVVDSAAVPREVRVDAERTAVRGAIGRADERVAKHLGLSAGVGNRSPVLLVRAVTERGVEDPDRREAGPVVVVERAAERLAREAELAGMVAVEVRVADLPDECHRCIPDAAPVEGVPDVLRAELRSQWAVLWADEHEHARRMPGCLVPDLLLVGRARPWRPDVDVDDVERVHDEWGLSCGVREHAVERGRLGVLLSLARERPDRRARRVDVGSMLDGEAPVREAVLRERVRVELQLQEPLLADLVRVRVLDRAAEPERRPDARYREGPICRQLDVPRDVLRGARRRRDGIELGLVVTRASRRVVVVPVLAQAADDVRKTGGGACADGSRSDGSRGGACARASGRRAQPKRDRGDDRDQRKLQSSHLPPPYVVSAPARAERYRLLDPRVRSCNETFRRTDPRGRNSQPGAKRLGRKKPRRSGASTLAPAGQFDLPARGDYSGGDTGEHHTVQHETGLAREIRHGLRRKRAALLGDDRAGDVVVDRAVRLDHELDLAREDPGTRVVGYEAVAVSTYHLRAIAAGSGLRAAHREHAGHRKAECQQNQSVPHASPSLTPPRTGHGQGIIGLPGSGVQVTRVLLAGEVETLLSSA